MEKNVNKSKLYTLLFGCTLLFIISCGHDNPPPPIFTTGKNDSLKQNDSLRIQETNQRGDTLYRVKDFIISCKKDMKYDLVFPGFKDTLRSMGETLYKDINYIILGEKDKLSKGIFKKYKTFFDFQMYAVDSVMKKVTAPCNYKGNVHVADPMYRTIIDEACKKPVNFGGHYSLIEVTNGASANMLVLVDRINGKVYDDVIGIAREHKGYLGARFFPNSKMLILNSALLEEFDGYRSCKEGIEPEIWLWNDKKFIKLE